jgi:hypothetical protein
MSRDDLVSRHSPKLVRGLVRLTRRLELTPEPLRGPFIVRGIKPYAGALERTP